jgi:pSer/pThr/pTyr-binding forkhead associated (FHA) protein
VVNLMSVNGTFVNGRKVLSAYLKTTDKIRLGNVELAFDAGEAGEMPRARGGNGKRGLWSRLGAALKRLFGRG